MLTTLVQKKEIAEGTMLFCFKKPEGFDFVAGQTVDLTLIEPQETDAEGNMRTYSLCSAPREESLEVATRMRDTAFKRSLGKLPVGSSLQLEGPFGSFLLHENIARPAVFLAGGIGITPFRSIILDATARHLPHELFLFYSNRQPEDAPFLKEFQEVESKNEKFKYVPTMTSVEESSTPWSGERGYISAAMLEKYIPKNSSPIYYLAGPQAMVTAMRQMLAGIGVSRDDIRFEEFTGY